MYSMKMSLLQFVVIIGICSLLQLARGQSTNHSDIIDNPSRRRDNMTEEEKNRTVTIEFNTATGKPFDRARYAAVRQAIVDALNRRNKATTVSPTTADDITTLAEVTSQSTARDTTEASTADAVTTPVTQEVTSTAAPTTTTPTVTTEVVVDSTVTLEVSTQELSISPTPGDPPPKRRKRNAAGATNAGVRDYELDDIEFVLHESPDNDGKLSVSAFGSRDGIPIPLDVLYEALDESRTLLATAGEAPVNKVYTGLPAEAPPPPGRVETLYVAHSRFQFWLPILLAVILLIIVLIFFCIVCDQRQRRRPEPHYMQHMPDDSDVEDPCPCEKQASAPLASQLPPTNGHGPRQLSDNDGWIVPLEEWTIIDRTCS